MAKPKLFLIALLCALLCCFIFSVPSFANGPVGTLNSSIVVTYPDGGQNLFVGSTCTITWNEPGAGSPFVSYKLYYSTDSGSSWTNIPADMGDINITAGVGGSYDWTVPDDTTEHARVAVVKKFYNPLFPGSSESYNASSDFTITKFITIFPPDITIITAPAAPSNPAASASSPTEVQLSWTDNSDYEVGFEIERKHGSSSFSQIATVGSDTTEYADLGVTPENTYIYRVRAYNAMGNSDYTGEVSATPPAPSTPPTGPSNLTAAANSQSEIKLLWIDNSATEDGYKIERKEGSGSFSQIVTLSADTINYVDSGLSPDTTYTYRVCAYNSHGDSSYSNEDSTTTMTEPSSPPEPEPSETTVVSLFIGNTIYLVNGEEREMDTQPIVINSRTFLPIRYVAQPIGADLNWDGSESKATISLGGTIVELWVGQNTAKVNGEERLIDTYNPNVSPFIQPPGRVMLPLRFISESLGCQVDWIGANQEARVTYPASP